jgi:hypothetical protein
MRDGGYGYVVRTYRYHGRYATMRAAINAAVEYTLWMEV